VMGPTGSESVSFAYRLISDLLPRNCQLAVLTKGTRKQDSQQCSLPHARGPDNGDEARWRLIGDSVDEGDMEALFPNLQAVLSAALPKLRGNSITSCDRAACFASFPGFEKAKALGFFSALAISELATGSALNCREFLTACMLLFLLL
jgi:hypothetical protein